MKSAFRDVRASIDWILLAAALPLVGAGLVTMNSFSGESAYFYNQLVWIPMALIAFFVVSMFDLSFLKRTRVIVTLFSIICGLLILLFALGTVSKGAQSWFNIGLFSIQPSDPAQIVLILLLAKYFSRRHMEIRNIRHILVSGLYALIAFALIIVQPDFGGAIIIFFIWFGMVLVSGISKKHLLAVVMIGAVTFAGLWMYVFKDYQKARIMTFIHPLADIHGAGYNAYQSTIAVGSGQMLGKGIGYGTQSKLSFLPEYQTDFIFAAFAEEWGFVGVIILFILFSIVVWRILLNAMHGASNFETLYGAGLAIMFMTHIAINVGMNIGLLPVTGVTIPFMSYGGSHLVTEFIGLGILMSMRRHRRAAHRDIIKNEFIGI
ncbi:MAG: rod shape-determining protein RodA [bacterium]|nr:rod shape-determining protein RodA [bacterium]